MKILTASGRTLTALDVGDRVLLVSSGPDREAIRARVSAVCIGPGDVVSYEVVWVSDGGRYSETVSWFELEPEE